VPSRIAPGFDRNGFPNAAAGLSPITVPAHQSDVGFLALGVGFEWPLFGHCQENDGCLSASVDGVERSETGATLTAAPGFRWRSIRLLAPLPQFENACALRDLAEKVRIKAACHNYRISAANNERRKIRIRSEG
jgi:hypothetical protein